MSETIERAGAETRPYGEETAGGKPPAHIGGEQAVTRTPEMVGAEIRSLSYEAKCVTVWYAVQIGKRLTEAKSLVRHGEWLDWLSRETEYSQPTASRLMRIYAEYGADQGSLFGAETKYSTLNNLSVSNALRLLAVPEEERESFAKEVDAEHLSAKELEQAIRERDEARKEAEDAAGKLADLSLSYDELSSEKDKLEDERDAAIRAKKDAEQQVKELESRPVEVAVQEPDPEAVDKAVREAVAEAGKKHADELAALQKKLEAAKKAEEKAKAAQKKAEEEKADAEKTASEKAEGAAKAAGAETAALQAEVERLKKELQLTDAAVTTFRERFSTWQASYNSMIEALGGVEGETAGKLRGAVRAMLTRWEEALGDGS